MRHKPVPGFVMFTQEGKPLWLKPADIRAIRPKGGGHPGSILDTYGGDLIRLVDQSPLIAMRRLKKALEEVSSPVVPGQGPFVAEAARLLKSSAKDARFRADAQDVTPWSAYIWAAEIMETAAGYLGEEGKEPKE